MRRFIGVLAVVLAAATACTGQPYGAQRQLQSHLASLKIAGAVSAVAQLVDHGRIATAVAGTAGRGANTPLSTDTHYRTGSVTKTFVSTVVLQLVAERKLSLDDTVDKWMPGLITGNGNDGTKITIRQLLQHTSGLFDYTSDRRFVNTISTAEQFNANRDLHYSPQDLIKLALTHSPTFAPAASWRYSNTNYVVIGLIIKAITGNTWDVEVRNRIISPLGLTGTSVRGDTTTLPYPFAHGYNIYAGKPNRLYTDTTEENMTSADAAGSLITTIADAARFFSALLGGGLLPATQLAAMKATTPIDGQNSYGLGLAHQSICGNDIWWHNGDTVGYNTFAGTTSDGTLTLVYDIATTDITNSDKTFDNDIHRAQNDLIRHAFCGST